MKPAFWWPGGKGPTCQCWRQRKLALTSGWQGLLEEEITAHSRTAAWQLPRTEEPGGLQSLGLQRVEHHWTNERQNWRLSFNMHFNHFARIKWVGASSVISLLWPSSTQSWISEKNANTRVLIWPQQPAWLSQSAKWGLSDSRVIFLGLAFSCLVSDCRWPRVEVPKTLPSVKCET